VNERVEVRHHVRGRRRYNALIENVAQESIEDRRMAELAARLLAKKRNSPVLTLRCRVSKIFTDYDLLTTKRRNNRF
jgi:hypothetical protein